MNVGRMRDRLTIESRALAPDGVGGQVETWTPEGKIWAEVQAMDARMRYFAAQVQPETTHTVRFRATTRVTENTRFLWGSKILRALGAPQYTNPSRAEMVILCHEEVPQA